MRRHRTFKVDRDAPEYTGPYRRYDIVKEGTIALVVMAILTVGLAVLFGSPDEPQRTIKNWALADPTDFVVTAASELSGSSLAAAYGPPYNNALGAVQELGPFHLPDILGVRIPINTANDFVLNPLRSQPGPPALESALATYDAASASQQLAWANAYVQNSANVTFVSGNVVMPTGNYGPVAELMQSETAIARSGALDQALITGTGFYTTDYTKPDLFLADGTWFGGIGDSQNLGGDQWGMMNETNSYPGQAWLWLYTMLYQIPPYNSNWAANADVDVWFTMIVLSGLLIFIPFIPGLRSIPRLTRVYRLIWRNHYRSIEHPDA
ncbi:MAG TPA: hypothetical protein VMQ40_05865 [Acidimicrobiales bacterium]|jgi:hypothetical protein|nr:hypothetical protein [Acidimicrobiales bacterium]